MTTIQNHTARWTLTACALLAFGLLAGGCDSDTVAPQDTIPPITQMDAANQAGAVSAAAATVCPEIVKYTPSKDLYERTFGPGGDISGTVYMEFFTGGATGTPAEYDVADYGHLYTAPDEWLGADLGEGGSVELTFDITADIDQGTDTAVVSGSGTFVSGDFDAAFTFTDLSVSAAGDYPGAGIMAFTGSGFLMVVTFDGSRTAIVSIADIDTYIVDLDTGEVSPLDTF